MVSRRATFSAAKARLTADVEHCVHFEDTVLSLNDALSDEHVPFNVGIECIIGTGEQFLCFIETQFHSDADREDRLFIRPLGISVQDL